MILFCSFISLSVSSFCLTLCLFLCTRKAGVSLDLESSGLMKKSFCSAMPHIHQKQTKCLPSVLHVPYFCDWDMFLLFVYLSICLFVCLLFVFSSPVSSNGPLPLVWACFGPCAFKEWVLGYIGLVFAQTSALSQFARTMVTLSWRVYFLSCPPRGFHWGQSWQRDKLSAPLSVC